MNIQSAQYNMIKQQINPWCVLSPQVLNAFITVDRQNFTEQKKLAYADIRLPIADNEFMLEPKTEARALQALDIKSHHNILEIGTGSGYVTAILASLGKHVDSIEINPTIATIANTRLTKYNNINIEVADIFKHTLTNQYDIIVVGALHFIPENIKSSLQKKGKLLAFIQQPNGITAATLMYRLANNQWSEEIIFETHIPDLIGAPKNNDGMFIF